MSAPEFLSELARGLRSCLELCEEALALAAHESQALAGPAQYEIYKFHQSRKTVLERLDQSLPLLRAARQAWQKATPRERGECPDFKALLKELESALTQFVALDHENQEMLLRRDLVSSRHIHFVHATNSPHSPTERPTRHLIYDHQKNPSPGKRRHHSRHS